MTTRKGGYAGFLDTLVQRFEAHIGAIQVEYNFDYGAEFEIAVCKMLRDVLPTRVGVCRGFVVSADGTKAGDDIILFDASRFPTLRLLGEDLSRKEAVPADAMLAYIEAKHTLYLEGSSGQSLAKAQAQVRNVKSLVRTPVPLNRIAGFTLGKSFGLNRPDGLPPIRNPYFAAIWAPNINFGTAQATMAGFLTRIADVVGSLSDPAGPDLIAAGTFLASPAWRTDTGIEARAVLSKGCQLAGSQHAVRCLALSLFQILWAIEEIELNPIEWGRLIVEALDGNTTIALPPEDK